MRPLDGLWALPLPPHLSGAAAAVLSVGCRGGVWNGSAPQTLGSAPKYNTGVVLMRPGAQEYARLLDALERKASDLHR